jgi:hypothetical protein
MRTSRILLIFGAAAALSACEFSVGTGNNSGGDAKAERNESGGAGNQSEAAEEEMRRFVNSRDYAINERLRERYIDFSFEYPRSWARARQDPPERESNFVLIRAPRRNGSDTTNVAFGTAGFNNAESATDEEFEQLMQQLGRDMGRQFDNFRLVSYGRQRLGRHDTWGWRFSADIPRPGGGEPVRAHGRGDIYLPEGQSHGLYVLTITTDAAEDFPAAREVGESGDLRRIFDSLSFGEGRGSGGERPHDDSDEEPR